MADVFMLLVPYSAKVILSGFCSLQSPFKWQQEVAATHGRGAGERIDTRHFAISEAWAFSQVCPYISGPFECSLI